MIASAGALALLLVVVVARPSGQTRSDKAVYFTFSQPVALPGKTLPAGRYMFKLLDSQTIRTVVQVFNSEGTQLQATFMTIPAERLDPPNDAEVRFMEASANGPAAIRTWWYPGERRGWEFIYPRNEAMQLAKNSKDPVLTTAEETSVDKMNDATLARVGANGEQTPVDPNASPSASAPAGTSLSGQSSTGTTGTQTTGANRGAGGQGDRTNTSSSQANPSSGTAQAGSTATTGTTGTQTTGANSGAGGQSDRANTPSSQANPSSASTGTAQTGTTTGTTTGRTTTDRTTTNPNSTATTGSASSLPRAGSSISNRQSDQPSANQGNTQTPAGRTSPSMQTAPSTGAGANDQSQTTTPSSTTRRGAGSTGDRSALPQTASATPMVLLIGIAAFAAAWLLRRVRPLA